MSDKGIILETAGNGNQGSAPVEAPAANETAPAAESVAAPAASAIVTPKKYYATIHPGPKVKISAEFAMAVKNLEKAIEAPIWLLYQPDYEANMGSIDFDTYEAFFKARAEIPEDKPVALLIQSDGGLADFAFRIARLFQRRANPFIVIVPRWAKSAATLAAIGASSLIMGRDAELGPLDVQIYDPEKGYDSALNAVQSLERLNAFAMTAIDQAMFLMLRRTKKVKWDTLLPTIFEYATKFVEPLVQKIDSVDLTKKSRDLKVAEQYATRLMKSSYEWGHAERTARDLVERYSTHGFMIDAQEASAKDFMEHADRPYGLGLKVTPCKKEMDSLLDQIIAHGCAENIVGQIMEMP